MAIQQESPDKGLLMIGAVAGGIVLLVLSLGPFLASDAKADRYRQVIETDLVSAIDSTKAVPLNLQIVGRCKKGIVTYKITNRGGDWPKYSFIGIYRTGFANPVLAKRIKMRKGETKTFRVNFGDKPIRTLEMKIKPAWLKQLFKHRFKHTAVLFPPF